MTGSILVVAAVRQELAPFLSKVDGEVRVLLTGIGPHRARQALERELRRRTVGMVLSAGFSGATRPGFKVGDLVAATEAVEASSGRRFTPFRGVGGDDTGVTAGRFVTVEKVLSPCEKQELGRQWDSIAVDMETAAVAQTASQAGIPWAALRVILDPVETALPVTCLQDTLRWMAAPSRWSQVARFFKEFRSASGSLSNGLQAWIPAFAGRTQQGGVRWI